MQLCGVRKGSVSVLRSKFKSRGENPVLVMSRSALFGHSLKSKAVLGLMAFALLGAGCASVKIQMPGSQNQAVMVSHERTALALSANQLKNTPWPKPTKTKASGRMINMLFGADEEKGLNKEQACEIYVDGLRDGSGLTHLKVLADADETLSQGRALAEAGRMTTQAIQPTSDDVAMMEAAIADLQESRDMYVMSLKKLRNDGEDVSSSEIKELKRAFTQTIIDIGRAADVVAEKAAQNKASQYAEPQTSATGSFSAQ